MPAGDIPIGVVQPVQHVLWDADAVVLDAEDERAGLFAGAELYIAVVHVGDAVDYRVLDQRLQYELGHYAVLEPLVNVDLPREAILEPERLNVQIFFQQLQLALERDEPVAGDARAQQHGKSGGDGRDLRHAVRHAEPLDAVECII